MKHAVYARDGRDNNFHLIRHLAALAVVLTHSYSIVTGQYASEPLVAQLGRSIGHYAVDIFFILSGFVVTQSLLRDKDLVRFAASRALRVFPALFVAVFATVFVLGPLVSTHAPGDYFGDPATWRYLLGATSTLAVDGSLPGVFTAVPESGVVNLPLWTLKYELAAYILLAGLAAISLFSGRAMLPIALIGLALAYLVGRLLFPWPQTESFISNALHLNLSFLIGASAYVLRHKLPLTPVIAILLFAVTYAVSGTPFYEVSEKLFIGYSLLWLAFMAPGRSTDLSRYGDVSYGLYIFAFPIQQTLFLLMPELQPLSLFALSVLATLPVAYCSWHLIEKPSLARRGALADLIRSVAPSRKRSEV